MTFYDNRGVTSWLQFEAGIKGLMSALSSYSYSTFVITNTGTYVFGSEGGVGKIVGNPVNYNHSTVPERCVGDRWDCLTVDGVEGKIEKVENVYLGQIIPSNSFNLVFRSATQNLNIVWGAEQELARILTPTVLHRLMSNRYITSPASPVSLNVSRIPKKKSNRLR